MVKRISLPLMRWIKPMSLLRNRGKVALRDTNLSSLFSEIVNYALRTSPGSVVSVFKRRCKQSLILFGLSDVSCELQWCIYSWIQKSIRGQKVN